MASPLFWCTRAISYSRQAPSAHYGGPLAEGLVDETIRCPWHHARFDLRTGEAEGAPALNPVSCFNVQRHEGMVMVNGKKASDFRVACKLNASSVVIVGAGAAGAACADMLRAKGYAGPVTLAGDEKPGPVDRPNLSKDFLAGTAGEDWIPLRTPEYYESIKVDLVTDDPAVRITPAEHRVSLCSGRTISYGALLLATGAEPRSLPIEGADLPHVYRLRTLADSKAIIAKAQGARSCAVIGSGFIGLEVAASLRHRGLAVSVIGQDSVPLSKILGAELGRFIQKLHEEHGVRFFMNAKTRAIRVDRVDLGDGQFVEADLVILGGVSPRTALAEAAGIRVDDGIIVGETLRTSAADVFVAGDIARYPEPVSGDATRIEHWVVAERQGQAVARSMLGIGGAYREAPFFWSQHYDVTISYVGHAGSSWESCEIRGALEKHDACAIYRRKGRTIAVATIGRDHLSLRVEAALEQGDAVTLDSILRDQ
jgi:apoptosis-inducing factor 3